MENFHTDELQCEHMESVSSITFCNMWARHHKNEYFKTAPIAYIQE